MKRQLTCIVCPRGCQLEVTLDEAGKFLDVTGNICKRGAQYALDECTHPMRTVTSTVRCKDGAVVAVKTSTTIPKEKIFLVMDEINKARPEGSLSIGDVIISRVCDTDADVVATANSK